jgi:FlaA1/EpsC-like NDP-sugar epimerase
MGATKRVAEIYLQALSQRSSTRFVTVRFGNVLGSNGSVIPIFRDQIASGGPVTVTHPEMRRYFMTIPEASQLVLQAGAMGNGGEIYILDMGEPVRILDLAQRMIRLAGLRVGTDVEVRVTGVRPGEKLVEDLLAADEPSQTTAHPAISRIEPSLPAPADVHAAVQRLGTLANELRDDDVRAALFEAARRRGTARRREQGGTADLPSTGGSAST